MKTKKNRKRVRMGRQLNMWISGDVERLFESKIKDIRQRSPEYSEVTDSTLARQAFCIGLSHLDKFYPVVQDIFKEGR